MAARPGRPRLLPKTSQNNWAWHPPTYNNVADASADEADKYDLLVVGSSTWGCGELQDDWYSFLDALKAKDLAGKKVAIFGCGDSGSYPDTFCDAVGLIYDGLQDTGCTFVGSYAPAGYGSIASLIVRDGKFVGLAIDESDPGKTDEPGGGMVRTD